MNIWSLASPSLFFKVLKQCAGSSPGLPLCCVFLLAAFPSSTLLLTFFMTLAQMVQKSLNFRQSPVEKSFFLIKLT